MSWEISILHLLEGVRGQTLNILLEIITLTAESALLLVIIAIVYWCVDKKLGRKLGFIMLFSLSTNNLIKNLVKAPRPFELGIVEPLRKHTATGYSFPSGHTQGATTFWSVWMTHIKKRWLYYLGSVMVVLVAISRLYLGVHWPIDVIAAVLVGIVITLIGQRIFGNIERLQKSMVLLWVCIPIWSTLLLRFDNDYVKSIGAITGFIIGFILERSYISFTTEGPVIFQVYKIVIGFLGLAIIFGGVKFLLPGNLIFGFIRYVFAVIWIIAGAPYMFMKWKKQGV